MLKNFTFHSASLFPQSALGQLGWLRGSVGAALAIALSAIVTQSVLAPNASELPWLVAPLGASAVLVFAVPASPLAQPWSLVGGNLISSVIGLAIGMSSGDPVIAPGLAVGLAIAVMTLARCLHPPGGACALLCAIGATGSDAWGWFYLVPILVNVMTLCALAAVYNNLTGHRWPHTAVPAAHPSPPTPLAHTREDIEAVLAGWENVLDVDVDDLDAFFVALAKHREDRENSARPLSGQ